MLISELDIPPQSGGYIIEMAETRLLPVFDDKDHITSEFGGVYDGRVFVSRVGDKNYNPDIVDGYDIAEWMVDKELTNPAVDFDFSSYKINKIEALLKPYNVVNNIAVNDVGAYYNSYEWDNTIDTAYGIASDMPSNTMALYYPVLLDGSGDVSVCITDLKTGKLINDHTTKYFLNKIAPPARITDINSAGDGAWAFKTPDNDLRLFLDNGTSSVTDFDGTLPVILEIQDSPLVWQTSGGFNWVVSEKAGPLPCLKYKQGDLSAVGSWDGDTIVFPGGCREIIKVIPPRTDYTGGVYVNNDVFFVAYIDTSYTIRIATMLYPSGGGTRELVDVTTTADISIGSVNLANNVRQTVSGYHYSAGFLYVSFSSFGAVRYAGPGSFPVVDGSSDYYLAMVQIQLSTMLTEPCKFLKVSSKNWRISRPVAGEYDDYRSYNCVLKSSGKSFCSITLNSPLYSRDFLRLGFGEGRQILDGGFVVDPVMHYGGIKPHPDEYTDGPSGDHYMITNRSGEIANMTILEQGVSGITVTVAITPITSEMKKILNGATSTSHLDSILLTLFSGTLSTATSGSVYRNSTAYPISTTLANAFKEFNGISDLSEPLSVYSANPSEWINRRTTNIKDVGYDDFNQVLNDPYGNISAGIIVRMPANTQYAEVVYSGTIGSDGDSSSFGSMGSIFRLGSFHTRVK